MNIAIEALGIHRFGGGRSVTLNLLEALFQQDFRNKYLLILTQPELLLKASGSNVRQWIMPIQNRFMVRLWAQIALPPVLQRYDLVHFIKDPGVFGVPTRQIMTIHDLTALLYPELFPLIDVWYWRYVQRHNLRALDRIIAVSKTTARDISRFYGIAPDRIRVIYNACAAHFKPAGLSEIKRVQKSYGLPEQFIVHVGRIDRKKNLPILVEAFAYFCRTTSFKGKLVLVGAEYKKSPDRALYPTIRRFELQDKVIFTGPVPDDDLPAIYSGAMAAVFPSFHEGFGLVALEAMACGTPLIVTRAGALPEVVGDAAFVLESPCEAGTLAEALALLVRDPTLRDSLRHRGITQAQHFRWADSAHQLLQLYEEVADH